MSTAVLRPIYCPDCGKMLFKAVDGSPFDVELICSGIQCKAEAKIGKSRLKRLTYPNPITKSK